jgi:hypothetical protein
MLTDKEILRMANALYEEQERLKPFLSIRRCAEILHYDGGGSIQNVIERMVQLGLAKGYTFGEQGAKQHYRFKKPFEAKQ